MRQPRMLNHLAPCESTRQVQKLALLPLMVVALSLAGCASYQFGAASMFQPGIQTIHVPIVKNETFRHDLGVRLSEAIVKEIDRRTPYKVTGNPNADSTLWVTITDTSKQVLSETNDDDPRALNAVITASAKWTSRSGEQLMQNNLAADPDFTMAFGEESRFVPEAGQSIDTATQETIEKLAARIVSQMETRW